MPDFSPEIRKAAERAIIIEAGDFGYDGTVSGSAADLANAVLDAVAADLGQVVAAKILASYDEIAPAGALTRRGEQDWHERRKCYHAAALVAALAFMADGEVPEDGTREH